MTNLPFLLLLASVFGLARPLLGVRGALWAATLTAACPPLAGATWYLGLDLPLAAMIMAALWLLTRCGGFRHARWTLAFGLWAAFGLMVKYSFAIYLVGPCAWALFQGLRRPGGRARVLLIEAAALALMGLTVWLLAPPQPDRPGRSHAAALPLRSAQL